MLHIPITPQMIKVKLAAESVGEKWISVFEIGRGSKALDTVNAWLEKQVDTLTSVCLVSAYYVTLH